MKNKDRRINMEIKGHRVHIIHDRIVNRTVGYILMDMKAGGLYVVVAEARCHPKDNFCKRIGCEAVIGRLTNFLNENNAKRVFNTQLHREWPKSAREWRRMEEEILRMADTFIRKPAAVE